MKQQRRPRRFFSEQPLLSSDQNILISANETRHFQKTLRLMPGAEILLSDAAGREAHAVLEAYEPGGKARVRILELKGQSPAGAGIFIRLFVSFAAKGVMDQVVEKCQELGVEEFRPVFSERTVVTLAGEKEGKVLERWYKIIREAAKQSGQTRLMTLAKPGPLKAVPQHLEAGDEAVFFQPGSPLGWGAWLESRKTMKRLPGFRLNLFIGPEGGFSDREVQMLRQQLQKRNIPLTPVHLGASILRVETAVVAAVASARVLWS